MCGIAGCMGPDLAPDLEDRLGRAATSLRHRGPDGNRLWHDRAAGVGFAHTRLAILDLSPAGAQPMHSRDGRFVIAYNGEIYNHREIRGELEAAGAAVQFQGSSDTATLIEACARWSVTGAVQRCIGMFAFALWDRSKRVLYLARDRLGVKPLYWGYYKETIVFASELKALVALTGERPPVDRQALREFMRYGYVPSPGTIYTGICKLSPGCILSVRAGKAPEVSRYWSLEAAIARALAKRERCAVSDLRRELEHLLGDAVRQCLLSDVPLGAFLSGGIDSSTVVAFMQAHSARPVRTFSVGFREPEYNEALHADEVARHLGTEHRQLVVTPGDALDCIPRLPEIYDEPFADSSQIPTCLIARLTREHVKVALSGDGGDEIFAGYNRHVMADGLLRRLSALPPAARSALRRFLLAVPPHNWDRLSHLLPRRYRPPQAGDKMQKLAAILAAAPDRLYQTLVTICADADDLVPAIGGAAVPEIAPPSARLTRESENMQYQDALSYLPDDILTKVDRATMAVSLECRVPLLDHRLVECAWSLSPALKIRNGKGKWILREILKHHVPPALTERAKAGFTIPLDRWLRDGLRDWAESLLQASTLNEQGYLNAALVRQKWNEHLTGTRNWQHQLWNVLMFQAWHERWAA